MKWLLRKLNSLARRLHRLVDCKLTRKFNALTMRWALRTGALTIVFAPQVATEGEFDITEILLDAIGHPEAWVSDMSSMYDFYPAGISLKEKERIIKYVRGKLGVSIRSVIEKDFGTIISFIKEKRRGKTSR